MAMHRFSPVRNRVVDYVVEFLGTAIDEGRYSGFLPGERTLADTMGVSRTMVRAGIKVLQRRGVVTIAQGKRTRISKPPGRSRKKHMQVCILAKGNMAAMSHSQGLGIMQIQQCLNQAGYRTQILFKGPSDIGPAIRRVRQLVEENPADCWVLYSGNLSMQRFFSHCGVPAFLFGRPCPGVVLPHAYIDAGPACNHAVAKLRALGHRRIGLLQDETPTEAHRVVRASFLDAMKADAGKVTIPLVIAFKPFNQRNDLYAQLDKLMHQPEPLPTAFVVETPFDSIALLISLSRRGFRVPEDVSIICLGFHPGFSNWRPRICCYGVDELNYSRRNAELILQIVREGGLPKQDYSLAPEFIKGDSVAPPPETGEPGSKRVD